jgi:hypothetical protein
MPANNKSNINKFIIKANSKHGNNKYDYKDSIYVDQNTNMDIYCNSCEEKFRQKPKAHLGGSGCPTCSRKKCNTDEFIKKSRLKYGNNTFDYTKCIYTTVTNPVILICNNCENEFLVIPNKHLCDNRGCFDCKKVLQNIELFEQSEKLFWEKVKTIDTSMYDLSFTKYNGSRKNIEIQCLHCGPFLIREDTFRKGAGCYKCVYIKNKHKEGSLVNVNNISENWKQCSKTQLYFSPYYQFAYSFIENKKMYPNDNGKLSYNNIFIDTIWNLFKGEIPNTKYVTFIEENIEKKYLLENITLVDYKCKICNIVFQGYNKISSHCGLNCRNQDRFLREQSKRQNEFKYFILGKLNSIKKREKNKLEYGVNDFLDSELWNYGNNPSCYWCGISNLDYADNNITNPNKLTIDSINPPHHYKFEYLVPSCLLCNRMLLYMPYDDRVKLIQYLKGEKDLDLSNLNYSLYNQKLNKECVPWNTIKKEKKLTTIEEARIIFLKIYNNQNEKCNIIPNYPIFYFKNCIYSISCDRIIPKNNENYQLIPQFLNFAKNNLSQEDFMKELEKRNYLNNKNVRVILPHNYYEDSYFIYKLKNRINIRLGKIRNNNISIIAYYNSNNKEFISLKECSEYFNICPKTIKNNINGKTEYYNHKIYGKIEFKKI